MSNLTQMSANDIVAIASAGVMGLAALVVVGTLFRPKAPQARVLWMCIAVLLLGAVVQLADKWMQYFVNGKHFLTVNITPTPSTFSYFISNEESGGLQSKPYIWLAGGPSQCVPNQSGYDPAYKDCPGFDQTFPLLSNSDVIDVSVEAIMVELHGRLLKAQLASRSNASQLASLTVKDDRESQISQDLSTSVKAH
ncbi:hypothetical protein ELE36_03200 [Pseudolysobacter antarcticus]|uniref:Uncharacterized protein n=1 Tax=Pseudolysobacter antarcticus TaxID=2511995 RepID=A0A411HG81_9GAMM|nr:hypothetical protein [Pseudolysobacter antarcticus]QBB69461.1 hypothetical protein ELE36_03200 [Pseudolysobacter antarcticus]